MSGDDIRFESPERPTFPDGDYSAIYTHHETAFVFKTPKVFVWFRIVSSGPAHNAMVYRAYRVRSLTGKARRNGGFAVKRGMEFYSDMVRALDVRARPDRISATALANKVWCIRTRTVTHDYRHRALPDWDRYSVVDTILRAETS